MVADRAACSSAAIVAAYVWATGRHAQRLEIANLQLDVANDELSARNLQVDAALNNMVQGFIMFDAQERIVVCNDRYIEMYGLSREIVKPGCSLRELFRHRAAIGHLKIDPDQYREDLLAELAKGEVVTWVIDTADGREISVTNKPMTGGGWVVTHEDITERRRAEAKISHMALHDGLTDLANRYLLDEQVASCFEQLERGRKFAVLCLDLDHFKNVNDTLGHPFGDKILKEVGTRLRGCVREMDTVARIGGDEFAILQRDVTDPVDAKSLSKRIDEVIGMPFDLEGSEVVIGVSIGIAIAPTNATDGVELLKAADLALFRAKTDGRGTYRFFEYTMDGRVEARRTTLETLRQLRALGVSIVMDDFGTGHSSLSYLRNFPFDKIKIDRVFVHDLSSKKNSRAIIRAVAQLAGSLGMETTGEGVETKGELDFLKRVGCTEAQGHFFSRAVPANDIQALLARPGMRSTWVA